MNEISLLEAQKEIGTDAYTALRRLTAHMGDLFLDPAKISQSIITRSEVELFGLSLPRFAVRLYLKNGGFINCRRIATLIEMFKVNNSDEWGIRYTDMEIEASQRNRDLEGEQLPNIAIEDVLRDQSCIADSLLPEPRRFSHYRFKYVDTSHAKLPHAYTEPDSTSALLPYTHTIGPGGGLCAQAVCFMATAILAHQAKSVHGIAEITALAHDPRCRELALGGLDLESMARYFSSVNLRLSEQCLTQKPTPNVTEGGSSRLESTIRCYLNSGMPVILPTSAQKLAKHPTSAHSIYRTNGLMIAEEVLVKDEEHVVIIIGSASRGVEGRLEHFFSLHDSATVPFLVVKARDIAHIGVTRKSPEPMSDNGVIMPVVPKPVLMPLLDERNYVSESNGSNRQRIDGLRFGLDAVSRLYHHLSDYPCRAMPNHCPDRFSLVRSDRPRAHLELYAAENRVLLECGLLRAVGVLEDRLSWHKPHWLWIESFHNSLWIWDAEVAPFDTIPRTRDDVITAVGSGYLLATVHVNSAPDDGEITFF